jgi:hypothetical protein
VVFSERLPRIEEAVDAISASPEGEVHIHPKSRVSTKDYSHHTGDQYLGLQTGHFAVKEYPTSDRLDKDVGESFQEVAVQVSIAAVCFAYLLHLNLDLLIQKIIPLVQYSAKHLASLFCYASFGGFRNTARYSDAPQIVSYRDHEKVQVVEPWAGITLYRLLALVVGVLTLLEFLVKVTGRGKKASYAVDTWTGRLTYTTCLPFRLIEAICGALHSSHPNSPGAAPAATYRSGPAHAHSTQHPVHRKSFLHLIRQRVRSLTYLPPLTERQEGDITC